MTLVPPQCREGMNQNELIYYMVAACRSDDVNVFGSESIVVKKDTVAFLVVLSDLFISIVLFLLFSFLKTLQELTAKEIDDSEVTAKDFGIEIRGLPLHDNVREFKAALWQWIEMVNEKCKEQESQPHTGIIDEN